VKTTKGDRHVWRRTYEGTTRYAELALLDACDDLDTLEEKLRIAKEALEECRVIDMGRDKTRRVFYVAHDALARIEEEGRG
jgi:hypothetical protein